MNRDPWATKNSVRTGSESDSESDSMVGSDVGSYERTHARTDVENSDASTSSNCSERARAYGGFTGRTLGELLDGDGKPRRETTLEAVARLTDELGTRNSASVPFRRFADVTRDWADEFEFGDDKDRWPVVRTGDRGVMSLLVRSSVIRRDMDCCVECGLDMARDTRRQGYIEIDHIVPWSAGGPDDSDNLRVLCRSCNQHRSNLIDIAHLRAYRPTTWWCFDCWSINQHDDRHEIDWRNGINLGSVPYVDEEWLTTPPEQAFCAFCQHYTLTTHLLVGDRGRQLVEACGDKDLL